MTQIEDTYANSVMKANEAPKEIYLLPDDRNPDGLSICWYEAPYSTGAIEYTRTDAFIEKACKWLEDNLLEYWGQKNAAPDSFIEDFRNYLKGELL